MKLDTVKEIKVVSTNIYSGCTFGCNLPYNGESFEANVNHYLQEHGYKLLHVGQESSPDDEGKASHSTIAVLSRP
jgi:hypothetical protein